MPKSSDTAAQSTKVANDSWREVILENALDAVIAIDQTDTVIEWNHQAEIIFGYSKQDALGQKMTELIIPKESREAHSRGMKHFLATGEGPILNKRIEVMALHRTGCHFPVELTVMPVRADGVLLFYSFLRDISERKRYEQMLKGSEQRFRSIFSLAAVGMVQADPQSGAFVLANEKYCQITGYTEDELKLMRFSDLTHPEDRERDFALFQKMVRGETAEYTSEKRCIKKTKEVIWVSVNATVLRDDDGNPVHTVAVVQDITSRKQIEGEIAQALFHAERLQERLDAIFSQVMVGIAQIDLSGRFDLVNQRFCDVLGRPMEEVLTLKMQEVTHPDDLPANRERLENLIAGGPSFTFEKRYVRPDGSTVWVSNSVSLIRDKNGEPEHVVAISEELTERKKAEETQQIMVSITENSSDFIGISDMRANMLYINRSGLDMVGRESFEGSAMEDYFSEDDYARVEQEILPVLNKKGVWKGDIRFYNRGTEVHTPVSMIAFPVLNKDGEPIAFANVSRNIIEVKEAQHRLEEAVRARDELISICSHELKTPVTSLKLQFQMAAKQLEKGDATVFSKETVAKRTLTANRQLDRMTNLIEEMLDVSRIEMGRLQLTPEILDLYDLTYEVVDRFADQFRALGLALEFDGSPVPVKVTGDRYRIEQVISNLLTNALKYGAGSPVSVSLHVIENVARVAVKDRGMGIEKENCERIFSRFERAVSSASISGLGLGLYISREILNEHRGRIWVESEVGKGSTFFIEMPLSEKQV